MTEDEARRRLVLSMCPERVCNVCGEPSRRIIERERVIVYPPRMSNEARILGGEFGQEGATTYQTIGWTDCGHNDWRPGVVLDPFA